LSQDVFLGEVLIPLREVEEAGATGVAEVHKYILGRRSTKERVSGEIALACSWRVTPLDVVIMKVSLFTLPCSTAVGTHTPHLILSCAWVKVQWVTIQLQLERAKILPVSLIRWLLLLQAV